MSLSEMSYQVRRLIPLVAIGFLILMILYVIIKIAVIALTPPPKVEVKALPTVILERDEFGASSAKLPTGLQYKFITFAGVPEDTIREAAVYFKPAKTVTYGSFEKVKVLAKAFGFADDAKTQVRGNISEFSDTQKTLSIDATTFNYTFERRVDQSDDLIDLLLTEEAFIPTNLAKEEVEQRAVKMMTDLGRYPEELARGTRKVIYYKVDPDRANFANTKANLAPSESEANMVEVDFFPEKIGDISVHTEGYHTSPNYIVFIPAGSFPIVKAKAAYVEHSATLSEVYPLKSAADAYTELQQGQGIVAGGLDNVTSGASAIPLNQISVVYVEPDAYTVDSHLKPYYMFSDGRDFVAYVPAVINERLKPEVMNKERDGVPAEKVVVTPVPSDEVK
ncbi:MAG: hypothetical protein WCJ70_03655 [bacterium]